MVVSAEAIYEGGRYALTKDNQTGLYTADIKALKRKLQTEEKYSYYPVMVRVTDDAGNVTVKTIADAEIGRELLLIIREADLFPMKFIISDAKGQELGFLNKSVNGIDIELGEASNDFEIEFDVSDWDEGKCNYNYRIYAPGTEYGGLVEIRKTSTSDNLIRWGGFTWRGLLEKKIIEPPANQEYLTVSGDANKIMADICAGRFGSLFVVDENCGINIKSYRFDRYTTMLSGFEKMLATQNARLKIYYQQGEGIEYGAVHLCAVPINDWSKEVEFSQDGKVQFETEEYRCGINHLICAGKGEGVSRLVVHLYVQENGTIGEQQHYLGLEERTALYSYTSVENVEQLKTDGIKRLKEQMNYKKINVNAENVDIDIGDIVGGRDYITGMDARLPIVGKIIRIEDGKVNIEYKTKGDE